MPLHLKRISPYVNKMIKSKGAYHFPKYNLTGQSSFLFALLCGVRGAGKSVALLNLLNIEKEHLLKDESIVYLISPTRDAKIDDFIETYPENVKYYDELSIDVFNKIVKDIEKRIEDWKATKYVFELFEKFLKDGANLLEEDEMAVLVDSGILDKSTDVKKMIDEFNHKHPPRSSLCIDDSMGSPIISSTNSKPGKEAVRWFIRHRHFYCNVFILSQHFRGISKPIRSNTNMVLLWPSKDRSVLKSIFDEFSPLFKGKIENYEESLDLLDSESHQFLLMYYDEIKQLRLGFDRLITFE